MYNQVNWTIWIRLDDAEDPQFRIQHTDSCTTVCVAAQLLHSVLHRGCTNVRLRLAKVVKPTYRLHTGARVNAALLTYLLTTIVVVHHLNAVLSDFEWWAARGRKPPARHASVRYQSDMHRSDSIPTCIIIRQYPNKHAATSLQIALWSFNANRTGLPVELRDFSFNIAAMHHHTSPLRRHIQSCLGNASQRRAYIWFLNVPTVPQLSNGLSYLLYSLLKKSSSFDFIV